jgi:predicted nucleic acid-binding protein
LILVDTNVLLDVLNEDPTWERWSSNALGFASARDELAFNAVVYAELSAGYEDMRELDDALSMLEVTNAVIPNSALFLAGHAYRTYRSRKGTRTGVLSDFFIGAHAAVEGATILTRDPRRIRAYFPTVSLISP